VALPFAMGELRIRRWNDPAEPEDGVRILVCRYRPRGVARAREPWDAWWKELGPSAALHADAYGKRGPAIDFEEYRRRFLAEMAVDPGRFYLRALVGRLDAGETITLLCSSACTDEARCHRSILRELALAMIGRGDKR
jgi:uncharacterized protein YeaO (DUF488 family)